MIYWIAAYAAGVLTHYLYTLVKNKKQIQTLYLVRGLPDSGKTTFAKQLCPTVYSADDAIYHMARIMGKSYAQTWHPRLTAWGHDICRRRTFDDLQMGKSVAVANTFTKRKELSPYLAYAKKHDIRCFVITVERNGTYTTTNGHGVPEETLKKMGQRWQHVDQRIRK